MIESDDIDRLLTPVETVSTPGLRDRLRVESSRHVHRKRWARRTMLAAALAACFGTGMMTMHFAHPAPAAVVEYRAPHTADTRSTPDASGVPSIILSSPRALELAAEQTDGADSVRLYFEAGRRYGQDLNDWQSALRCYR